MQLRNRAQLILLVHHVAPTKLRQTVTGAHNGQARSILRATATDFGERIPCKCRTVGQILSVQHPNPSTNKKLKTSLCGKGRADHDNSERLTFIDDASLEINIVKKNTDS